MKGEEIDRGGRGRGGEAKESKLTRLFFFFFLLFFFVFALPWWIEWGSQFRRCGKFLISFLFHNPICFI